MGNFEEKLLNTHMTKKMAKENILFDFDDIQQTFCPEKSHTSPQGNPHTSKNLPCINESKRTLGCRAMKVIKGLPKSLGLPQICGSSNIETEVIVRRETPWETYRRIGVREVAGQVIIAADRSRLSRMRTFREYKKVDAEKMICYFRNFNHLNILTAQECYEDQFSMYALVDHHPLTLNDLICCHTIYPTEAELASIISQVDTRLK